MAAVAKGAMTALPLIGSGLVSKIGGGIAGLFKTKGAKKAQQVFGGIGSVGNALSGGGSMVNEAGQRIVAQGAQNMIGQGKDMINYGSNLFGGMKNAFYKKDYGGMMNQAFQGINKFGQMGHGGRGHGTTRVSRP